MTDTPKILKQCIRGNKRSPNDRRAYITISRYVNGELEVKKSAWIHQLVMLAFIGPCPLGLEIRHINGDSLNNQLHNMAYGTHSENMQDAVRHGTQPVGELARDAKLKEHQVLEIRERYANGGITQQQLANEYGVDEPFMAMELQPGALCNCRGMVRYCSEFSALR